MESKEAVQYYASALRKFDRGRIPSLLQEDWKALQAFIPGKWRPMRLTNVVDGVLFWTSEPRSGGHAFRGVVVEQSQATFDWLEYIEQGNDKCPTVYRRVWNPQFRFLVSPPLVGDPKSWSAYKATLHKLAYNFESAVEISEDWDLPGESVCNTLDRALSDEDEWEAAEDLKKALSRMPRKKKVAAKK